MSLHRKAPPSTDTKVEVAIQNDQFNLLSGTPLILNGPVTSNKPESNCFKNTTLLPLNLPASTIKT